MISVTLKKRIRGSVSGWLFVLPMTVGICVFTLVPIVQSFYYSFFNYDVVSVFDFVGFGNYIKVFTESEMSKVVTNTLFFAAVNIPVVMCGSYLLALFLNVNVKGIKVFRVLYYLPCVMPAIVGGIVWSYLMRDNPETPGIFNQFLISLGLSSSAFFNAENLTAILSIVLMNLWSLGGGTIIWLAQFKNIPKQLYEAAEMDGAGAGRKFFSITLPMSTPMIFYNLIMGIIGGLQIFTQVLLLRNPNNSEALNFFVLHIYDNAMGNNMMGYASALSWILFVIIAAITAVTFKTSKWVYYGEVA